MRFGGFKAWAEARGGGEGPFHACRQHGALVGANGQVTWKVKALIAIR